jgi:hypothetical protein
MSLYSQDFSEYTTGNSPSDWTDRWDTDWTYTAESEAGSSYGAQVLKLNPGTTNAKRLLSWDDIDADANRADSEVLVRFIESASYTDTYMLAAILRGSGAGGSESCYACYVYSQGIKVDKYVNGVTTTLDTVSNIVISKLASINWSGQYNWIRFRANGTSIQARVWTEKEQEPDIWQIDVTDSAVSAAGWCGVGVFKNLLTYYFNVDYFAVGTNGDSPVVPLYAAAETQYNQGVIEVARAYTPPAAGGAVAPIICINT